MKPVFLMAVLKAQSTCFEFRFFMFLYLAQRDSSFFCVMPCLERG